MEEVLEVDEADGFVGLGAEAVDREESINFELLHEKGGFFSQLVAVDGLRIFRHHIAGFFFEGVAAAFSRRRRMSPSVMIPTNPLVCRPHGHSAHVF